MHLYLIPPPGKLFGWIMEQAEAISGRNIEKFSMRRNAMVYYCQKGYIG
jgi:hypothetical protein